MTADQSIEFFRWMMLLALLGGFLGALAWDLVKVGLSRGTAAIAEVLARRQRIAAARKRAEDSFFESQ